MHDLQWLLAIFAAMGGAFFSVFWAKRVPDPGNDPDFIAELHRGAPNGIEAEPDPSVAPKTAPDSTITPNPMPTTPEPATSQNKDTQPLLWDTPQHAYHSTRVICDQWGLTLEQKNTICACIYQESQFLNTAKHANAHSTDWGICQINDRFHIGPSLDFPSVQFILANPDRAVKFMIRKYQDGQLGQWVSYSSGAYQHWLNPQSPMWTLAEGV